MRDGLKQALRRAGETRRFSGMSLVAMLCAAALAPVLVAGTAAGPVLLASVGVAGSIGAGVLTDLITKVTDRLRREGKADSPAAVEAGLAAALEDALAEGSELAPALREATAALLRGTDAAGALVELAAAQDRNLVPAVMADLAGLGEQFGEFAFVATDIRRSTWRIEEAIRRQHEDLRIQQERSREQALTLQQILSVVERDQPGAGADTAGAGTLAWPGCPYRGLAPFEEGDARVFFGRTQLAEKLTQRLGERLADGGILLVVGASGAGKSSLLRAGLLPRVAAGALDPGSAAWPRRVLRPTGHPLRELALHLADMTGADSAAMYRSLTDQPELASLLAEQVIRAGTAPAGRAPPRLLLVVDQFEELFTAGADPGSERAEQQAFVTALHAAATVPAVSLGVPAALVVVAVRADFLDRTAAYPELAAAAEAGPFIVGPMSEGELRQAINGPAAAAGLVVEPGLAETVIGDLGGAVLADTLASGILPLLSQAMAATWELRAGSELTIHAYHRAGGVNDAVNRAAQAAYRSLSDRERTAARLVFSRLTIVTPEGRLERRQCSRADLRDIPGGLSELVSVRDIDAVIGTFSAHRLLVLADRHIEISHDVLLRAWRQLRDWASDERADRVLYGQVITDAQAWQASRRDPAYLYRPGRLAGITDATARWSAAPTRFPPLSQIAVTFLDEARRAAGRSARRLRAVIAVLVTLTVASAGIALIAVHYASRAAQQHAIALSRQLAADVASIDPADPVTARQLAVAAWSISPTSQARAELTALATEQQDGGLLAVVPGGGSVALAFSPDGRLLASADSDGTIRLWNPLTGRAAGRPIHAGTGGGANALAFSPDGRLLASADADGTIRLWNPATGQPAGRPIRAGTGDRANGDGGVLGVAFSPDGKLLASAGGNGIVRLWNPATGRAAGPPILADPSSTHGSRGFVNTVAFSPSGRQLAAAGGDGVVRVWNPLTGRRAGASLPADPADPDGTLGAMGQDGFVYDVAFSPNGKLLASVGTAGTVRLENPRTGKPVGRPLPGDTVAGPYSVVNGPPKLPVGASAVAFSPDGHLLASAEGNGLVRLWNPVTGRQASAPLQVDPGGTATAVAFSPDGRLLATAGGNGAIRLWNPATGKPAGAILPANPAGIVRGMAFSPDGRLLATADANPAASGLRYGSVGRWDLAAGQPIGSPLPASSGPTPSSDQGGGVGSVAFSPDGRLLASADADGTVRIWNPATGYLAAPVIRADRPDGLTAGVSSVAFTPDGKLLASADADGTVRIWNPATGHLAAPVIRADRPDVSVSGVNSIAFTADGKLLASADADGTVRIWNPATGQPAAPVIRPGAGDLAGNTTGVTSVTFSPDGHLLASADADTGGIVRLWNPVTGHPVGRPLLADASDDAGALAFSPSGRLLATADADGTVRLWNVATGELAGVPIPVYGGGLAHAVAFSASGSILASADDEVEGFRQTGGTVQLEDVALFADTYAALCAEVGPPSAATWRRFAPGEQRPDACGPAAEAGRSAG
jgi:WD40 repeat protein